jgi:hypothetical protein
MDRGRPKPSQLSPITPDPTGKTVVFDFDQTLTEMFAAGGSPMMLADPVQKIFGGAGRVALLDGFLGGLRGAGVTLAVLSFNQIAVIRRALAMTGVVGGVDLLRHFHPHLVIGAEACDSKKAITVSRRIGGQTGSVGHRLLFVDDDQGNCRQVAKIGCSVHRVAGSAGLQPTDCALVAAWAGVNG